MLLVDLLFRGSRVGEISKLGCEPILEYASAQRIIISPMQPYMGIGYNIIHSTIFLTLNLGAVSTFLGGPHLQPSSVTNTKPGNHNGVQTVCVINTCDPFRLGNKSSITLLNPWHPTLIPKGSLLNSTGQMVCARQSPGKFKLKVGFGNMLNWDLKLKILQRFRISWKLVLSLA